MGIFGITKDEKVILIKLFRPGPAKIFYEFTLGIVEKGEDIKKAAEREFLEETGYRGELQKIGVEHYNCYARKTVHLFLAKDCVKASHKLKLDEGEFIEVCLVDLSTLRKMLKNGQIRNFGMGYRALDILKKL